MIRTLLLPGLDGSPAPHWQHWWAMSDPSSAIVEQASWSRPCPDQWLTEIAGALLLHPGAVLVGHSLGAIAAVKLLLQWPQLKVGGALLVAPAEPSRDPRTAVFGRIPEAPLPVPTIVVASRNDSWMDYERARELSARWRASFVDLGEAGHINVAAGFGPWPQGRLLRALLPDVAIEPAALRLPPRPAAPALRSVPRARLERPAL
ncbi:alpha/beta hydrolase [Paracoccus sp. SSJ]|uniref:RBBP9/YdeN family alpha/beta hydrolase n=1 Tax=Paracoccus sp. SSJ TaxID=3050636 RepID=UPI00254B8B14|nr:alpha/beta hydrolase [Paracoccus sp. SSJ]MDK8871342.1 alpha/beta hydrolase [Paracoccus sp. SSJ]